jgi:voltage-gated potassium channel Kch
MAGARVVELGIATGDLEGMFVRLGSLVMGTLVLGMLEVGDKVAGRLVNGVLMGDRVVIITSSGVGGATACGYNHK